MNTMKKKRPTIRQQVARLRAANDRAEARLRAEISNRPTVAAVWRKAFRKARR